MAVDEGVEIDTPRRRHGGDDAADQANAFNHWAAARSHRDGHGGGGRARHIPLTQLARRLDASAAQIPQMASYQGAP